MRRHESGTQEDPKMIQGEVAPRHDNKRENQRLQHGKTTPRDKNLSEFSTETRKKSQASSAMVQGIAGEAGSCFHVSRIACGWSPYATIVFSWRVFFARCGIFDPHLQSRHPRATKFPRALLESLTLVLEVDSWDFWTSWLWIRRFGTPWRSPEMKKMSAGTGRFGSEGVFCCVGHGVVFLDPQTLHTEGEFEPHRHRNFRVTAVPGRDCVAVTQNIDPYEVVPIRPEVVCSPPPGTSFADDAWRGQEISDSPIIKDCRFSQHHSQTWAIASVPLSVTLDSASPRIVSGENAKVFVWNADKPEEYHRLCNTGPYVINCVDGNAWSGSSARVEAIIGPCWETEILRRFDLEKLSELRSFSVKKPGGKMMRTCWDMKTDLGKGCVYLATMSGEILLCDPRSTEQHLPTISSFDGEYFRCVIHFPEKEILVVGGDEGRLFVIDLRKPKLPVRLDRFTRCGSPRDRLIYTLTKTGQERCISVGGGFRLLQFVSGGHDVKVLKCLPQQNGVFGACMYGVEEEGGGSASKEALYERVRFLEDRLDDGDWRIRSSLVGWEGGSSAVPRSMLNS